MAETTPQAAPDLSSLAQPGSQADTNAAPSTMESASPVGANNATAANAPAYGEPGAASEPSTVVSAPAGKPVADQPSAPPPHAKLLAMIQGLSVGLGAAAQSIATHGKEGGAAEVQRFQGEQQRQKEQADAAATAQKNASLQQKLWQGEINKTGFQNHLFGATIQDQVDESHFKAQEAKTSAASAEYSLFAGTGMNADQIDQLVKGGPTDAKTSNMIQSNAQMNHRIAEQLLPADNPSLVAMKNALGDPNTPPGTLITINNRLQAEMKAQEGVNDAKIKEATAQATAPFGEAGAKKMNDIMLKRYQASNKGATELPQGYSMDASSTPKDLDRVDKILQQTEVAQGTQANRDIVNGMREQMLNLAKGAEIPGDDTKTGLEYRDSLPAGIRGTVTAIGEGREAPPPAGSRSPAAQSVLGALNQAYPGYDATRFPVYQKTRADFTSGGQVAKSINGGHTVLQHLDALQQLNTTESRIPGTKAHQAFQNQLDTLAPELARFYGNETVEGIAGYKSTLGSLFNRDAAIKQQAKSMKEKFTAYQTQWNDGAPPGAVSPVTIFGPKEQATYGKITGEGGATNPLQVTAPDGSVHTFSDQKGVDVFKKLAGIQ